MKYGIQNPGGLWWNEDQNCFGHVQAATEYEIADLPFFIEDLHQESFDENPNSPDIRYYRDGENCEFSESIACVEII